METKIRLLDLTRHVMRLKQRSLRTEAASVSWVRRCILFHDTPHPGAMGAEEIRALLTHLAVQGHVAASTPRSTAPSMPWFFFLVSLIPPVRVSQQPVPLSRLEGLEAAGAQLVIVSPRSACDSLPCQRIIHLDRTKALLEAAARYASNLDVYRSGDNMGDDEVSRQVGFSCIHPDNVR